MSQIILYNGLPIKLSKTHATKELTKSKAFCDKLANNINTGQCSIETGDKAQAILNRRLEWCAALESYLVTLK